MSPGHAQAAEICRYAPEHPRLDEQVRTLQRVQLEHGTKIDKLKDAMAEIRGAWRMAVVLGAGVGTVTGIAASLAVRLIGR